MKRMDIKADNEVDERGVFVIVFDMLTLPLSDNTYISTQRR